MEIWEATGVNHMERGPDPHYGYFTGRRDHVIEWVEIRNPGFKKDLAANGSKLRLITVQAITPERVTELHAALAAENEAKDRVAKAKGGA